MSPIEVLRQVGSAIKELAHTLGTMEARIDRLAQATGINVGIPEQLIVQVTQAMRDEIYGARARSASEEDWLAPNGPRDQICIRHHLARQQVAGVLAGVARESAGAINGTAASNGVPAQAPLVTSTQDFQQSFAITANPTTWPERTALGDGPCPVRVEYQVDDLDREIAATLLGTDKWNQECRQAFRVRRRLTQQQVAGLRAAITRFSSQPD